jgi:N-carbamoyl-L-amino-acid hydrolase
MPHSGRIEGRLQQLWEIAHGPGGGADRPAYSPLEAQAMLLVAAWAAEAGLEPGIDRFGNLWALPPGSEAVITSGSHVDTVPDGGRYDGALGTVLALELAIERPDAGVLICAAEEAPRFGAGTLGSRLLVGTLAENALEQLNDHDGVSAADARDEYLAGLDSLPRIEPPVARLRAHAEVHVATRSGLRELGVVTQVASPRRFEVLVTGQSGHSGEISMETRHDALAAAAEIVLAVEAAAGAEPAQTVATIGALEVTPGAISVIPGQVRMALDTRATELESLNRLGADIAARVNEIAAARGVQAEFRLVRDGKPVALDRGLIESALQAARSLGVGAAETWSGSGHDAQHLAALMPTLLVFVPLHGGESHTPQEGADMDEILAAAEVVAAALPERESSSEL